MPESSSDYCPIAGNKKHVPDWSYLVPKYGDNGIEIETACYFCRHVGWIGRIEDLTDMLTWAE